MVTSFIQLDAITKSPKSPTRKKRDEFWDESSSESFDDESSFSSVEHDLKGLKKRLKSPLENKSKYSPEQGPAPYNWKVDRKKRRKKKKEEKDVRSSAKMKKVPKLPVNMPRNQPTKRPSKGEPRKEVPAKVGSCVDIVESMRAVKKSYRVREKSNSLGELPDKTQTINLAEPKGTVEHSQDEKQNTQTDIKLSKSSGPLKAQRRVKKLPSNAP